MQWRRRIDPLKIFAVLGIALFGGLVWWFASHSPPDEGLIPLPVPTAGLLDAGVGDDLLGVDAGPEATKIAGKKPRTRRGKLVQRELERQQLARATDPSGGGGVPTDGAVPIVLSPADGAQQMARAFQRKLRGVRVVPSATSGYLVTLKMQSGGGGDSAWVKCSVTISELPQRKLASALSSRADVAGEGADRDELIRDAADACAASLAQDVSAWIRTHR